MQTTRMRPTFSIELSVTVDEAMERIEAELASSDHVGGGVSLGHCVELYVQPSERRLWSPHLSIQLEEADQGSVLNEPFRKIANPEHLATLGGRLFEPGRLDCALSKVVH